MITRRTAIASAVSAALASRGWARPPHGMATGGSPTPAATPTFSPAGGTYAAAQSITPSSSTTGATIYYTTDGSTPTTSSTIYATPISVSATETIKAIATATGYTQSSVASATYTITGGLTTIFDYLSGFNSGSFANFNSHSSSLSGTEVLLGTGTGHTADGLWYTPTQPSLASFTAEFQFKATGLSYGEFACAGITFCVQNSTAPPGVAGFVGNAAVTDANCCGYGAFSTQNENLNTSVALKYDWNYQKQQSWVNGTSPSQTGCYTNGGPFAGLIPSQDLTPTGVNFYYGNVIDVVVTYDGTILTQVIKDTVTGAQARFQYAVNIPAIVGSHGWVGWTQGEAPDENATTPVPQFLVGAKFSTGINTRLATPTASVSPGTYSGTQTVTLSGPAGASIYYSTNGLLPTSASTLYTSPITVAANTTLQWVAIESGYTDSLVGGGSYVIGSNTVNFPTNFASTQGLLLTGNCTVSSNQILLNPGTTSEYISGGGANQTGAVWTSGPVNINRNWQTSFTLNLASTAQGGSFTIQAPGAMSGTSADWQANSGPLITAGGGASLGFGGIAYTSLGVGSAGILNSVHVKFDNYSGSTTGIYTDGYNDAGTGGTSTSPVNLGSGHDLAVTLTYTASTTTLAMTITDTVTSQNYSTSWTVNIPATVGSNSAYLGFTSGSGGYNGLIALKKWTCN